MAITRNFKLFLNAGSQIPLLIHANQYDSGEQWRFTLYNQDGSVYEPSSGAIVGIKSDGHGIINTGAVSGGKVVITETQQMTAAAGKAVFELMIDGGSHGTANFIVLVEPKPGDQADLSESDLSLIQEAINSTTPANIASAVSTWMSDNLTPTTPVVDASLSTAGAAADAKKTGDEISDLKSAISDIEEQIEGGGTGGGLTNQIKTALLNCFANVMFKSSNSANLISALREALYSDYVAVSGISLNYSTLSIEIGSTEQLRATVLPTNASDKSVIWSSDNSNVATVDEHGYVTAVNNGTVTITAKTNDGGYIATCQMTVIAQVVNYTVSNSLTGCSNSNSTTSITGGSNYNAEIIPATGYRLTSVMITMSGNDITSSVYSNGSITIPNVTGNIIITATAVEIGNILQNTVVTTGKYLKTNDGTIGNSGTEFVTDDIDISDYAGQVILIKFIGATASQDAYRFAFYDSSNTFLECKYTTLTSMSYEVPANAKYMKLGGKFAGMTGITVAVAKNSIENGNVVNGGYYDMADASIKTDATYSHALLDIGACWAKVIDCSSFVSLDASQAFISAGSGNHNSGNITPHQSAVYVGMNIFTNKLTTATVYGTEDYQIGNLTYSA